MHSLRKFYIDTYHDQFFTSPPSWFMMYMWMEALYHIPLSVWAVGALLRNSTYNEYLYRGLHELERIQ
ncbi:hypothetical protein LTR37_019849 [Vermiconidia calcicola]|uniref:Uncharacterized protein n=1 Tax=Vermiconidia calcicola TaxID=1690605 RepID=A0ACC3MEI8_9PEZI|nr:hypothetical protein LTR37_019849 [Vermiconidia calcicola]